MLDAGILKINIIGASLTDPHSDVENGTVIHEQRTAAKNGIATHYYMHFGTVVHIRTNKHNKLMDTFMQVLSNELIFGFIY